MLASGVDVIVLGCTHYVFLREQIQAHVGPAVKVIDTGAAVAHQLQRKLQDSGLECGIVRAGTERFWASGQAALTFPVLKLLWPEIRQCEALPESACMVRHKASSV
jgi:glutamate racemase